MQTCVSCVCMYVCTHTYTHIYTHWLINSFPKNARYFPFGIVFLVAGKILEMSDPSAMGKKLGFYAVTVVFGLVLHGLFILPAMYFFITKKSPIVYIRGILQALLIALATSSRYPDKFLKIEPSYHSYWNNNNRSKRRMWLLTINIVFCLSRQKAECLITK